METTSPERRGIVVVTGAAGAIGTSLCRALGSNYTVVGLDRVESPEADDAIVFDLTSEDSVREAVSRLEARHGRRIESCIHLAAYFDFTGEDKPLYDEINVRGTRRLLQALRGLDVQQFVYSSTMLVHAPCRPGERIDESWPLGPRWRYPLSKLQTEDVIRAEHGSIPVVLLRLAGVYGEASVVPTIANQIARIYERAPLSHLYSGDVRTGQSTLHADDMIDAFARAVQRRSELPDFVEILVGEEDVMGYAELQDRIGCLIHGEEEWRTLSLPKPIAKAGAWAQLKLEPVIPDALDQGRKPFIRPFMVELADDHYALDTSRARELLGWTPRHRFREALPALVESLERDPGGWYRKNGVAPPPWLEAAAEPGAEMADHPDAVRTRHEHLFREQHANFLWAHFLNVAIGCWLMLAPSILGYQSAAMTRSDVISGGLLLVLALGSLSWRAAPLRWGAALVGLWLLVAPLLFWAPTSAAYLNGTLLGAAAIGLAAASRPPPGVSPIAALTGPTVPPGWTASPSSWLQRLPIIVLAFVGLFCSMYMTAYQLGHVDRIWDPFFPGGPNAPNGTAAVITSDISRAFPVPDAGLGAVVYTLEILLGIVGSRERWRTMPWVVASFGFLIVPLGIVSIVFIVIQPILIGTWCALCLIAAAAMLLQIAYSANELVATGQFLARRRRAGRPWLRIFFTGDTDVHQRRPGETPAAPSLRRDFERSPARILRDMWREGVTPPWTLVACALIGIWQMFTRMTLGTEGDMANADHLIGSLAVTVSVIAWAEVARAVRYLNVALGVALLITPFVHQPGDAATVASFVAGVLLIAAALPRGPVRARYGSWERLIV